MSVNLRVPHPEDEYTLAVLREQMRQLREKADVSMSEASRRAGVSHVSAINALEKGYNFPKVSRVQQWANGLGVRVEFSLDGFWRFHHVDLQMLQLYRMSRAWGADEAQRLWLLSALRQWRIKCGLSAEKVAQLLDMSSDALQRWELGPSGDVLLARMMWQARVMGTVLRLRVFTRDEWIFE